MATPASLEEDSQGAALAWPDHAREVLAQNGYRLGGARAAVITALAEHGCAASAAELHGAARAEGADLGLASVYRALELLEELGVAKRVELGERGARFEAIGPLGDHHHHMVCESCGTVEPFEDGDLEQALTTAAQRQGFTPLAHEVVFQGRCGSCGPGEDA